MQLSERDAQCLVIYYWVQYSTDNECKRRHLRNLLHKGAGERPSFFEMWREKLCGLNYIENDTHIFVE